MGYNTTIVVLNDALGNIGQDPDFGKNLEQACLMHRDRPIDVSSYGFVSAARVIEQHHANGVVPVFVGANSGLVGSTHHDYSILRNKSGNYLPKQEAELKLLKAMAEQLGYRLAKKVPK